MRKINLTWFKPKDSFLKSFDVEIETPTFSKNKITVKQKKSGRKKFSIGQVRKQAKQRGINLPYKIASKLAKSKQTLETLNRKLGQVKAKQRRQAWKNILSTKGANRVIYVYRKALEQEYQRHPTMSNLKKLQEASLLAQQVKLYDDRYKAYWKDIKANLRFRRQQLQASRHAGNKSKPLPVKQYGKDWEQYIMEYHADEVQDKLRENEDMTEEQALQEVYEELKADGTLEVLNQYYQVGIVYGYIDEDTDEIISPP